MRATVLEEHVPTHIKIAPSNRKASIGNESADVDVVAADRDQGDPARGESVPFGWSDHGRASVFGSRAVSRARCAETRFAITSTASASGRIG